MAQVIAVISDLIAKRRAGTATFADYLEALKVVISYIDSLLESQSHPVIGSEDVGQLLAKACELSIEVTGESLSVPAEGGSVLPIILAILKLLAAAA